VSVICEWFSGPAHKAILIAADPLSMVEFGGDGSNVGAEHDTVTETRLLASRASDPMEAEALNGLAAAITGAMLSGEHFAGWSDAYNTFYLRYAPGCGLEVAQ
jgi:hypothetical protein